MKLYGSITYSRKTWHVNADAHVIIRLKRLFARAKTETKSSIQLKDSEEVCKDLLWVLERYPMSITDKDRAYMESRTTEYDVRSEQVHELLSGTLKPREFELAIPAREYQKVAADMALRMKGLLIGDQIGVGKTITGICTLLPPESRPALVVTLTHLTGQWQREIAKFAPQLTTHILKKGTPYPLEIPDVIITNYHKLSGWRNELAGKINTVIYDEIQELRRPESQKYHAARHISREATYNYGLSGTPIYNLGIEFYHVIDILRPDVLGTTAEYTREWCSGDVDMNGRASLRDPKAFGLYLRDNGIMIRRTRKDIGRELPPVSKIIEYVDSDEKAFTEMEGGVADLAKFILAKSGTRTERMQASGELDWKMRQATGLAKCVAPTTKIVKFDGSIVEARTLQVGDLLMGPDSKPRKILATTEGLDEMYEVSSTSRNPVFNPYTVNSNHILALKHTGKIRHGDRFLFAHYNKGTHLEISVKDYISKSNHFKHMVKGYKSTCIDFDCTEVPIDPYFLGLWLGDGSSESASITTMDTEIREYLYAFASKCGLTIRVKFGSRTAPTYNLTRSKFTRNAGDEWRNPLRAGLVSCNVLHNKHIPKCYLVNDRNTRLNVLAGLLDSDGHLNTGNCYEISSKWKHMAEQICWLAQSLGFRTSLTKVTNKCQTGTFTAYKTIITGSGLENIPVLLPRKKASPRKQIKDALRSGIKVTPQGIGEYFGFELDGDGLFLLEDFTVTHNSPYVAEFVKLLVDSGEKVVVFAWHRAVYDVLMKKLAEYKPVLYTGSESVPQKEAARKAFVEGDSKILLMSLRSGAGLDGLQKVCSTVVIGELDWSPGVIEQCIGRVDRDEQDTPVMAYFAISNEGSDPVIMDSLGVKRGQIEGVRDPNGELILDVPMNENKIQQLAEAVLRKRGIAIPSDTVIDLPA